MGKKVKILNEMIIKVQQYTLSAEGIQYFEDLRQSEQKKAVIWKIFYKLNLMESKTSMWPLGFR